MYSQSYFLIRSRLDGSYLAAYPNLAEDQARSPEHGFILVFSEHSEALMYLNKHAEGVTDRFSAESLPSTQVATVLKRWGYKGIAMVKDPLIPTVEFLTKA